MNSGGTPRKGDKSQEKDIPKRHKKRGDPSTGQQTMLFTKAMTLLTEQAKEVGRPKTKRPNPPILAILRKMREKRRKGKAEPGSQSRRVPVTLFSWGHVFKECENNAASTKFRVSMGKVVWISPLCRFLAIRKKLSSLHLFYPTRRSAWRKSSWINTS